MKHITRFEDVPANKYFHVARHSECKVDTIEFYKENADDKTAWSPEWGASEIHADQPCTWFN